MALVLLMFLVATLTPSSEMVELKKLLLGLAALEMSVNEELLFEIIPNVSPDKEVSPSSALTPKRAFTGPTGMVLNPETVISAVLFPDWVVTPS